MEILWWLLMAATALEKLQGLAGQSHREAMEHVETIAALRAENERLRDGMVDSPGGWKGAQAEIEKLRGECAPLRAEIEGLKLSLDVYLKLAHKRAVENERLRAALERVGHMLVDMEVDRIKDDVDAAFDVVHPFFDDEKNWGTPRIAPGEGEK